MNSKAGEAAPVGDLRERIALAIDDPTSVVGKAVTR